MDDDAIDAIELRPLRDHSHPRVYGSLGKDEDNSQEAWNSCLNQYLLFGFSVSILMFFTITFAIGHKDKAAIVFLSLGDWGCGPLNCHVPLQAEKFDGGHNQLQVARAMASQAHKKSSDFVLALGNNFYWNGVQDAEDRLWKEVWADRFNYSALMTKWYAILGNHDYYGQPQAQIDFTTSNAHAFCKEVWTMPKQWYTVVMASDDKSFELQIVMIDTVLIAEEYSTALALKNVELGKTNPDYMKIWSSGADSRRELGRLQLVWLEETLNSSRADWLIVAGHYPIFSGGENKANKELFSKLKPLLERYGVDAYLSGHDHSLQHLQAEGVHYLVSGSAAFSGSYEPVAFSLFGSTEYGFLSVRTTWRELEVEIISKSEKILHTFSIQRKRNDLQSGQPNVVKDFVLPVAAPEVSDAEDDSDFDDVY